MSESNTIYTTIGGLSSKFDKFLAARSQFDSDHGVDFSTPTSCQSSTFVRPLFAFYCPVFFTKKIINNAVFRHRRDVYTADWSLDGDTVDGATVVGRDPAFIQPVEPRVLY